MRALRIDPDMNTVDAVELPDEDLLADIERQLGAGYVLPDRRSGISRVPCVRICLRRFRQLVVVTST